MSQVVIVRILQSNIVQSLSANEYNIVLYILCIKLMYRYSQISLLSVLMSEHFIVVNL